MLFTGLHTFGWDSPKLFAHVDLGAPSANRFAGPRSSQNREFQRTRRDPVLLRAMQPGTLAARHKAGRVVMLDLAHLGP